MTGWFRKEGWAEPASDPINVGHAWTEQSGNGPLHRRDWRFSFAIAEMSSILYRNTLSTKEAASSTFLGTDASIINRGLDGLFFHRTFHIGFTKQCLGTGGGRKHHIKQVQALMELGISKVKPSNFWANSSGFLRLSGHQSNVLPVTVIASDPRDLKASSALSATSPAPTTRNLH